MAEAGYYNWTFSFLVGLLFPLAAFYLGVYIFIVFTGFLVIFLVFIFSKSLIPMEGLLRKLHESLKSR